MASGGSPGASDPVMCHRLRSPCDRDTDDPFSDRCRIGELARLRWQLYSERESHDEPLDAYVERFTTFARDALARDDWRAWCAEEEDRLLAAVWLHTVPRCVGPRAR